MADAENVEAFLLGQEGLSASNNASRQEIFEASAQQEMKTCPKCGALNGRRSHECYSCHVIFERLEGLPQDPSLRAQPSLVRRWKNLLENFEDETLHEEFLRNCAALDALRFATAKYEEIRAAQGGDALCDRMLARIQSMMLVGLEQKPLAKKSPAEKPKWQKYLFWGPYTLSALLILWGMLNLGHRNLIGLGVAIFCMASGLIVMIKGKISLSDFVD